VFSHRTAANAPQMLVRWCPALTLVTPVIGKHMRQSLRRRQGLIATRWTSA